MWVFSKTDYLIKGGRGLICNNRVAVDKVYLTTLIAFVVGKMLIRGEDVFTERTKVKKLICLGENNFIFKRKYRISGAEVSAWSLSKNSSNWKSNLDKLLSFLSVFSSSFSSEKKAKTRRKRTFSSFFLSCVQFCFAKMHKTTAARIGKNLKIAFFDNFGFSCKGFSHKKISTTFYRKGRGCQKNKQFFMRKPFFPVLLKEIKSPIWYWFGILKKQT